MMIVTHSLNLAFALLAGSTLVNGLAPLVGRAALPGNVTVGRSIVSTPIYSFGGLNEPELRPRQSCAGSDVPCGDYCIPSTDTCCPLFSAGCQPGYYCDNVNQGCCPNGETCSGLSGCSQDEQECGQYCIQSDATCCPDLSGGCPSGSTCTPDGLGSYGCCENGDTSCSSGSGSGSGSGGGGITTTSRSLFNIGTTTTEDIIETTTTEEIIETTTTEEIVTTTTRRVTTTAATTTSRQVTNPVAPSTTRTTVAATTNPGAGARVLPGTFMVSIVLPLLYWAGLI